ncbi:SIMPL domain-containing protein [Lacrimispora saccharolytica]|nr:SIMPL domain-containing protein [Lacrimispora saccharolytica]
MNKRSVSIIAVAIILATGVIGAALILTNGIVKVKASKTNVVVTGSAKQQISSDLIVWTGSFNAQSANLQDAYTKLEAGRDKVSAYLTGNGIAKDDFVFSAITTTVNYAMNEYGNYTNEIDNYALSQTVTISSGEIDKITEISRNATELLNQDVAFESDPPQYFYTKLADLKVAMLAEATKDARKRAEMIVENAGNKLGDLKYADMGVMQITPLYSNEVDDYGINDTSSLEKEITAVVHCQFEIAK